MPKYEVSINEVVAHSVHVWAEDTDEAVKQARELIINGPSSRYYTESVGLDENSTWVEELKGDN